MNGDIVPPRRSQSPTDQGVRMSKPEPQPLSVEPPLELPTPVTDVLSSESAPANKPKRPFRRMLLWSLLGLIVTIAGLVAAGATWYFHALQPVDKGDTSHVRISVKSGSGPRQIGQLLYDKKIIRSTIAFDIYTRLSGTRDSLQAGAYSLSPSESTQDIVGHLTSGKTDSITITFYPGATLRDKTATAENKKTDVTTVLLRAGYTQEEIDRALAREYDHPLFEGRPAGADLEGYVYGETYSFNSDASVEDILIHTFDVFYQKIQDQGLVEPLQQRGFSLYQAITLASIVQREVSSSDNSVASQDQRQVAQVFFSRLEMDMPLGSDVTAYYGADQVGAERTVEVDTPYNTRKYAGLTPGPIAAPSIGALAAVANPAPGDYLYFLSGDDDVTYFGKTDAEHQENIRNHCHVKCAIP